MAFDFPVFDHGRVGGEAVDGADEEDAECEEGYSVYAAQDEEMGHGPGGGAEVGGEVAGLPDGVAAGGEVVGEEGHAEDGVEDEAEEMGEGGVRDAVGCPWAVVVHFGYTPVQNT